MKHLSLRQYAKYMTALSIMSMAIVCALLPANAFAASTPATKCAAKDLKCVIAAGDLLISNRLTSLNTFNGKVSTDLSAQKITDTQADILKTDVATNEAGLNTLKAKLDAEQAFATARQDVANIYLQFRIYAVVLPRDTRRLYLDIEQHTKDIMQASVPTIKAAIPSAPADKQAQLNQLFSDYQQQISAAQTQINAAQPDFAAMTPENFNTNRTSYQATKVALDTAEKAARKDLHQAANDLNKMATILDLKK